MSPVASAVVRRPDLWTTALAVGWSARRRGWWRRPPFLPVPSDEWVRWRAETAYGDPSVIDPDDVVAYLEWRRGVA